MKKLESWIRENIPAASAVLFLLAGVSGILHFAFVRSESFSDFFNRYVSSVFRTITAKISGIFPFSLAEAILIFSPVILVTLIVFMTRRIKRSERDARRAFFAILSVLAYVYSSFVLTFAAGYNTSSLETKLGLERHGLSAQELYDAATYLVNKMNEEDDKVDFVNEADSKMPYSNSDLIDILNQTYAQDKTHSFIPRLNAPVKQIVLSEPMTYTHISGVYSFFTGEANLNVNYPDFILPFTAAHEMAHQRGIAREDEANFVAYLICSSSDDRYVRYSAYMNMYQYVASALYKADKDLYTEVYYSLDPELRYELSSYSDFFDKYRDSVASTVTETVNNAYLTMQGTEGVRSYGMVTDLFVVYFEENLK